MIFDSIALISLAYIFLLFLIAYVGDRGGRQRADSLDAPANNNYVYALSLAVYCSSWTFYGAVGTASTIGMDYLAIYLGPFLFFLFGYPLVKRIILICKQNRITTISDFLSSRFGKSRRIAVLVTLIAVAGSLPYIALQFKAVANSYLLISASDLAHSGASTSSYFSWQMGLVVAATMALFTILFGTRHLDATEHHRGMIIAIAFESVVKLVAILAIGYYALYLLLDSGTHANLASVARESASFTQSSSSWTSFLTKLLLSTAAILLLPRQFQVTVVEAHDHRQFKTAMWIMPVYLVLTSIIVIPIAISGLVLLPNASEDMYVLQLPLIGNSQSLATLAYLGGLSAATGMVVVAAVSLSTMVCNDLIMPALIRRRGIDFLQRDDINTIILRIRRLAIIGLMLGAYLYFLLMDWNAQLANIGLVSFAAVVQFLPALLASLFWRGAHSKGVFWGLVTGFALWAYTLLLPTITPESWLQAIFGATSWLNPESLFGQSLHNPLTHGVVWSLVVNVGVLIYFSLREPQPVIERLHAARFFYSNSGIDDSETGATSAEVTQDALFVLAERIIGRQNAKVLFAQHERKLGFKLGEQSRVDHSLIASVQNAIAGVIGTASAQKLISETLFGDQEFVGTTGNLVDEASTVLKFNRDLLQTSLENISQGIAVVDADLNLVIWNDTYRRLFDYPENLLFIGKPIREIFEFSAARGDFAEREAKAEIEKRIAYLSAGSQYKTTRKLLSGRTIKAIGEPLPSGGFVTTYEDITEAVQASELLRQANEELESRVKERTEKLQSLTEELERNTQSKTHFLAAASHDLLQPINAARLFAHSILENAGQPDEVGRLAQSIDQSLVTANDLLRKLLDISKLDAGGIVPEPTSFDLTELFAALREELGASAKQKAVELVCECESLMVHSDKQLLHSVLQNLVANGLRYTNQGGRVELRAHPDLTNSERIVIEVQDTGVGIADADLQRVFKEFYQVKGNGQRETRGLGLGLSIVKRIGELLDLNVSIESELKKGTKFSLNVARGQLHAASENESAAPLSLPSASLHGLRVLLLDNDESVLQAMLTVLNGWGCHVDAVLDYAAAKRIYSEQLFNVVIADYRLDDDETGLDFLLYCNGLQLAQIERHALERQDVDSSNPTMVPHCILVTAEQDTSLKEQTLAYGFQYLPKPVAPLALKTLLNYLLKGGS